MKFLSQFILLLLIIFSYIFQNTCQDFSKIPKEEIVNDLEKFEDREIIDHDYVFDLFEKNLDQILENNRFDIILNILDKNIKNIKDQKNLDLAKKNYKRLERLFKTPKVQVELIAALKEIDHLNRRFLDLKNRIKRNSKKKSEIEKIAQSNSYEINSITTALGLQKAKLKDLISLI